MQATKTLSGLVGLWLVAAVVAADSPRRITAPALGDATDDLVYTPVAPCRVIDTRGGTQIGSITGPLTVGMAFDLDVSGLAATCNEVPKPAAKALMLNFVAVNPQGKGNLQAWPWDNTNPAPPNASIINYGSTAGFNIANGLLVPICNTATATSGDCTHDLFLQANFAATDVVIDVLGYFARPQATVLDCSTVETDVVMATDQDSTSFNSPSCPAGRTLAGGGGHTGASFSSGLELVKSERDGSDATQWACRYYDPLREGFHVVCQAICCKVPGR